MIPGVRWLRKLLGLDRECPVEEIDLAQEQASEVIVRKAEAERRITAVEANARLVTRR